MRALALTFIVCGILLIAIGGLLWLAWRFHLPLGRLPGDLRWEGKGWSVSFPIVTCIVLSIVLTIILNLVLRR